MGLPILSKGVKHKKIPRPPRIWGLFSGPETVVRDMERYQLQSLVKKFAQTPGATSEMVNDFIDTISEVFTLGSQIDDLDNYIQGLTVNCDLQQELFGGVTPLHREHQYAPLTVNPAAAAAIPVTHQTMRDWAKGHLDKEGQINITEAIDRREKIYYAWLEVIASYKLQEGLIKENYLNRERALRATKETEAGHVAKPLEASLQKAQTSLTNLQALKEANDLAYLGIEEANERPFLPAVEIPKGLESSELGASLVKTRDQAIESH